MTANNFLQHSRIVHIIILVASTLYVFTSSSGTNSLLNSQTTPKNKSGNQQRNDSNEISIKIYRNKVPGDRCEMSMAVISPYSLPAVETEKSYSTSHAKLWVAFRVVLYTLPWIICIVIATVSHVEPYPWWLLAVLVAQIGPVHSNLFRTTANITVHTDKTVSHMNVFGGTIPAYDHVSLQNYESIILDGKYAIYVKTESYCHQIRDGYGKCNPVRYCCVYKTESYALADPEKFGKDHGMYKTSTENDTLPNLAANWAKYRIDHRRLSTNWRRDKTTRDRILGGKNAPASGPAAV